MTKSIAKPNTPHDPVESVTHFIETISAFADASPGLKCYRGQQNVDWSNVPGLFRPDLVGLEENEKSAIRDLISVHPAEFAADQTMFDRLVRMQHFGLPTRLMDVSLNPLVALYFATDDEGEPSDGKVTGFSVPPERVKYFDSDAVSCMANLANLTLTEKAILSPARGDKVKGSSKADEIERFNKLEIVKRLIQFIKVEKPHFLPIIDPIDLFKPYYVHPKMNNRRILSQAGAFIIHGLQSPNPINYARVIDETVFTIPHELKASTRQALNLLGINESTLFPEIDKAAKRVRNFYLR